MMARRRSLLTWSALVLLAACSGAGGTGEGGENSAVGGPTSTSAPGATPPISTTAPAETTTSGSGANGDGGDETPEPSDDVVIDGVQWGPDSPPIPSQYRVWSPSEFGQLQCELSSEGPQGDPFWDLAASVCWALRADGEWPSTADVPSPPPAPSAFHLCLDDELRAFLQEVLSWRLSHPGQTLELRLPSAGARSPCQRSLFDVDVVVEREAETCELNPPWFKITMIAPGAPAQRTSVSGEIVDDVTICSSDDEQNGFYEVFIAIHERAAGSEVTINVASVYGALSTTLELPTLPGGGDQTTTSLATDETTTATTSTDETS
jgi:hypothetical protein